MQEVEQRSKVTKVDDNSLLQMMKGELNQLKKENSDLKTQIRENKTESSLLRSEIAELRLKSDENNYFNFSQ